MIERTISTTLFSVQKSIRQSSFRLFTASAFLGLAACSNTYVDLPPLDLSGVEMTESGDGETMEYDGSFPALRAAVLQYEDLRGDDIEGTRNEEARYQQALNAITFGALAGAGTAGVYGAHADTVLGFGLAGAGSYTVSSLFFPSTRSQSLNAANSAMHCVTQSGAQIVARNPHLRHHSESMDALMADLSGCQQDPQVMALAEARRVQSNFAAFQTLDSAFALELQTAGAEVIKALNANLEELQPTPQSVADAAKAIVPFASGFALDAAPPQETDTSGAEFTVLSSCPDNPVRLAAQTKQLEDMAARLDASISTLTNNMGAVRTRCVFEGKEIDPLTANPAEISVAKDSKVEIAITGAFGIPTLEWHGDSIPSSSELDWLTLGPDKIVVLGESSLAGGKEFKARISDQRPAPTPVTITVMTVAN